MKKLLAILLCVILLFSVSSVAYADEDGLVHGGENQYFLIEGESEVIAQIYSSCVVEIPATIDLTKSCDGAIRFTDINLDGDYEINVRVTNLDETGAVLLESCGRLHGATTKLYFNNYRTGRLTQSENILVTVREEDVTQVTNDATMCFSYWLEKAPATTYKGTIQYSISIDQYRTFES